LARSDRRMPASMSTDLERVVFTLSPPESTPVNGQ
jgi:hypothetical protein